MTYRFYRYPDWDSTIGIAVKGTRASIVILASGTSRTGKPGNYTYARRNPDKRKAAERLAYDVCRSVYTDADGLTATDYVDHRTRAGKKSEAPIDCDGSIEAIVKAHRKGGNYAFHLCLTLPTTLTEDQLSEWIGLQPYQNRPVPVVWF